MMPFFFFSEGARRLGQGIGWLPLLVLSLSNVKGFLVNFGVSPKAISGKLHSIAWHRRGFRLTFRFVS